MQTSIKIYQIHWSLWCPGRS